MDKKRDVFGLFSIVDALSSLGSFLKRKKVRISPLAQERMRFEEDAKDQFLKLKEKGLSISVFTL